MEKEKISWEERLKNPEMWEDGGYMPESGSKEDKELEKDLKEYEKRQGK